MKGPAVVCGIAALAACAGTPYVRVGPPPGPVEVISPQPGEMYVWTEGYWTNHDQVYVWTPGRWVLAPHQGAAWVPGEWRSSPRGFFWVPGRWENHPPPKEKP